MVQLHILQLIIITTRKINQKLLKPILKINQTQNINQNLQKILQKYIQNTLKNIIKFKIYLFSDLTYINIQSQEISPIGIFLQKVQQVAQSTLKYIQYQFQQSMRSHYLEPNQAHKKHIKYFPYQQNSLPESKIIQNSIIKQNSWLQQETETQTKRKHISVFDKLYQNAQQRLHRLRDQVTDRQSKDEQTFSFIPQTNRRKNRHLQNNVIQRGEIWMENKRKAQLNGKQQSALELMKDCTFSPKINLKSCDYWNRKAAKSKISQNQMSKSKSKSISRTPQKRQPVMNKIAGNNKKAGKSPQFMNQKLMREYEQIKRVLRNRVFSMKV